MLRRTRFGLLLALGALASFCYGAPLVICTETASGATAGDGAGGLQNGGCIASIPTSAPLLYVASDGEATFHPFGIPVDTSDAVQLNANWVPHPDYAANFGQFGWTQLPGTSVWYLPASLGPCGNENEPICEPAGAWIFAPGSQWNAGTPDELWILSSTGELSDLILVNNNGPHGEAQIIMGSDPSLNIPEPSAFGLLACVLSGAALYLRRRRIQA